MNDLILPLPDDFHVHLRQDEALAGYVSDYAEQFGRGLVMPNTIPPITTPELLLDYKQKILASASRFEPLMTFKLHAAYSRDTLEKMKASGAAAGKYYPAGVTTNSQDGISELESVFPVLEMMEDLGFVLSIHGEEPSAFCLDRESAFIWRVERIAERFPKLKVVFEHLSTAAAVDFVLNAPENVAATITVHHLMLTLDDVIGDGLQPHHFCKPLPKFPADREAVRAAAFSGRSKIFFGSDSAPHPREKKECAPGAAGVYTAPVAIPLLAEIFENAGKLSLLPDFIGGFGADFYGLPRTSESITLVREPWVVPDSYHGAVPLAAGKTLQWKLK
ncbi:MAG: dihydroorotase [Fibrobacter sp.]|jgi:dihydroorotase|nr:dihydroorotase [Fibrobacter sp.]